MSTVKNPHFRNVDRAPYELSSLLTDIRKAKSVEDIKLMGEAAEQHASNCRDTLLRGLDAIGHIMIRAYGNEEDEIAPGYAMSIGELISHIACELQFHDQVGNVIDSAVCLATNKSNQAKDKVPS